MSNCIIPECWGGVRYSRGLCFQCYDIARLLVNSNKTTWGDLEVRGLSSPLFKAFKKEEDQKK